MSFASKYQKRRFNANTQGFEYHTLGELFKTEQANGVTVKYPIKAIYINTQSEYGEAPVIATDVCYVNLPSHLTDVCKQMIADAETVDEINAGKAGFTIYAYEDRHGTERYSVNWIDL